MDSQPRRVGLVRPDHVLLSAASAASTEPINAHYLAYHLSLQDVQLKQIRGDRVLHEALAVNADPLHLATAFNLSAKTATDYADIARSLLQRPIEAATRPAQMPLVDGCDLTLTGPGASICPSIPPAEGSVTMSFVEKRGRTWRVRYWKDDGTRGSIGGFATKKEAQDYADDLDADQRRGTWIDPDAGKLTLTEWASTWFDTIDVAPATRAQYRSLTDNHILPRWGQLGLKDITGSAVHIWATKFRARGYATSTVTTTIKIMSMMLADASDERLIPANPIRPQRRGRRHHTTTAERRWATPEQVLTIALQAAMLAGPWAGILILTAAYTGARWGELTGLLRPNLHLDDGRLVIDPGRGALHEINGQLTLGPPKTPESARTITLPHFLIPLLRHHLAAHDHPHVFVTADGQLLRRSNFTRRAMRPAADGNHDKPRSHPLVHPVVPGLTFHGLRHSHKTWLIADGIPEIAQARRLGHKLPDKIQDIYSHVAPEVETRLLTALQHRWTTALDTLSTTPSNPPPIPTLTPTPNSKRLS